MFLLNEFISFLQKRKIWEMNIFILFTISPELLDIQRWSIPHFNSLKILLWFAELHFVHRCYGFRARKLQSRVLFFTHPLGGLKVRLKFSINTNHRKKKKMLRQIFCVRRCLGIGQIEFVFLNLRGLVWSVSRSLDDTHGLSARYSNRLTFLVGLFMAQVIEKKRLCRNTCT